MTFGLVILVAVGAIVYSLVHRRSGAASAGAPTARPIPPSTAATSAGRDLHQQLAGWVAEGLVSPEQASAIETRESARAWPAPTLEPTMVPAAGAAPRPPRRIPVVAEALGYLGGVLTMVGLGLVVARFWPDMPTAGRLALSGGAAVALVVGGAVVREEADPALARFRWFLWLASTAAAALFAGVLSADALDLGPESVVMTCAGFVAVGSGLLWAGRPRPLQQLPCLVGAVVFAGALTALLAPTGASGLAVWATGAAVLALGLRRRTVLPLLTEGVGAVAVVVGAVIVASNWQAFGLIFLVSTGFGLVALASVPGLVPTRDGQIIAGVVGALALLQGVPGTLGYFAQHAGVATGLVTWLLGGALIFIGSRELVQLPVLAQGFGGAAVIGGAALTGVQVHGFAPIFGVVTALGLVALGMLPGEVLLSVFGSLGLLINVPWTISWFFPGEGRAPLLIFVSGALILAVAVWMTRMGGRFRRELGGPHRLVPHGHH